MEAVRMQVKLRFIHIPKCSGTAFENYILLHPFYAHSYAVFTGPGPSNSFQSFGEFIFENREKNLIFGHIPYRDYFHFFPNENYVVFLREPIQRAISQYKSWANPMNWHLGDPFYEAAGRDLHEAIELCQKGTLKEVLLSKNPIIISNIFSNIQTRMLSLHAGNDDVQHLESSILSLRKMKFIGISNRFIQSVNLFNLQYQLKIDYWNQASLYENRSNSVVNFDEEILFLLTEALSVDIKLYTYANELFQKRLVSNSNYKMS